MLRLIAAATLLTLSAAPVMAQVNGYYQTDRSIYGGPSTTYWQESPAPYQPPVFQQQRFATPRCTPYGCQ